MINTKLYDEIVEYCKLNDIEDVELFVNKLLQKGFNVEKYGNKPTIKPKKAKKNKVEKEVVEEPVKEPVKEVITKNKNVDIYGE